MCFSSARFHQPDIAVAVVVQIAYSTYGFHGKQESGLQQSETPKTAKAELVALLRISFFPISHEIMGEKEEEGRRRSRGRRRRQRKRRRRRRRRSNRKRRKKWKKRRRKKKQQLHVNVCAMG